MGFELSFCLGMIGWVIVEGIVEGFAGIIYLLNEKHFIIIIDYIAELSERDRGGSLTTFRKGTSSARTGQRKSQPH